MEPDEHRSQQYYKKLLPRAIWRRLLVRQQQEIYEQFLSLFNPAPDCTVLNVGVNADLRQRGHYILESRYPYLSRVTAAGLESAEHYERLFPEARYLQVFRNQGLPFADDSFDLAFCSAVVEHVGSGENQRQFVAEVLRVARGAFFTTPNRWYPFDLHTVTPLLHWLPGRIYRPIYRFLGFDFFSREENLNLLDRSSFVALVPPGRPFELRTHSFLGLPSNLLLAVQPQGSGGPRTEAPAGGR